ncbi:MAG: CHASE2 domain-containing protein [bacterium]|nr:CHASE2 domain-containing protein [bacterium]
MPRARKRRPWKRFGSVLRRWGLYVLVAATLFQLDWFGLEARSRARSQDVLNQVFATSYPTAQPHAGGPKPPVVVLVTDDGLRARGASWPPSYRFHRKVLQRIHAFGPDGVLIDVLFADARPGERLDDLVRAFRSYGWSHTPVVLACGATCDCEAIRPDLGHDAVDGLRPRLGSALQLAPVPRLASHVDDVVRRYPLMLPLRAIDAEDPGEEVYVGRKPRCRTGAFQLHRARQVGLAAAAIRADATRFDTPLEVMWGAPWPGPSTRRAHVDCTHVGRLSAAARVLVGGDVRYACPSMPVFTVADLYDPGRAGDVAAAIAGAPVVYGMDLVGVADRFTGPIHGRQAGAHLHAMALDNLRHWGDAYVRRRSTPLWDDYGFGVADLVVAIVAGLAWAAAHEGDWWRRWARRLAGPGTWIARGVGLLPRLLYWPLALVLGLLLALAAAVPSLPAVAIVGYALFKWWALAPVNVVGQVFVTGTAELAERFLQRFGDVHAWTESLRPPPPPPPPAAVAAVQVTVVHAVTTTVASATPDHEGDLP